MQTAQQISQLWHRMNTHWWGLMHPSHGVLITTLVFIGIGLLLLTFAFVAGKDSDYAHPLVFGLVFFFVGVIVYPIGTTPLLNYDRISSQWDTKYAIPYIEHLPVEKSNLTKYALDPSYSFFLASMLGEGDPSHPAMWLVWSNSKGQVMDDVVLATIEKDLPSGSAAYMTYHNLETTIGDGYAPGIYDVTVHVPIDAKIPVRN